MLYTRYCNWSRVDRMHQSAIYIIQDFSSKLSTKRNRLSHPFAIDVFQTSGLSNAQIVSYYLIVCLSELWRCTQPHSKIEQSGIPKDDLTIEDVGCGSGKSHHPWQISKLHLVKAMDSHHQIHWQAPQTPPCAGGKWWNQKWRPWKPKRGES